IPFLDVFHTNFHKEGTMPVHKKKNTTTSKSNAATSNLPSPQPLRPESFHQYLPAEIREATRTVMEAIIREELSQFLGAEWGESTAHRTGSITGFYTRDLMTSTGPLEDLNVPRDRAGEVHTQAFEQYCRYEPQIAEGLTQMFVAGASTHKVGDVAQTLMGVTRSRQRRQPFESDADPTIQSVARACFASALARSVPRWHPFQDSAWGQMRYEHHFDGVGSRSRREEGSAGSTSLCRGG